MKWLLSRTSEIFSILSAILAFITVINTNRLNKKLTQEQQRLNIKIKVILHYGDEKFELPGELCRGEFTRNEILGRLGMIPMKAEGHPRFSLKYTNKLEFLQQMNNIRTSNGEHIFTIPCSKEEFDQFDFPDTKRK